MQKVETPRRPRGKSRLRSVILAVALAFLAFALLLVGVRLSAGRNLGLRSLPRTVLSTVLAVARRDQVLAYNQGNYTNIVFLHHSTGENLIQQGNLRQLFTQAGYSFWDQGYNRPGLRNPQGDFVGYAYTVPQDNTDPDGLARVFRQPSFGLPLNALSGLLQHEVIILKSCFTPTSKIASQEQLNQYQDYYRSIRATMAEHPDKVFILLTQPPLNPAETNAEEARRARELADWLMSDQFVGAATNIYVFDLFDYLAEDDRSSPHYNMLRERFRNGSDSHPNQVANQEIAPVLVDFVHRSVQQYRSLNP